eukprot:TRINITY_DN3878_c1_g1_i5.p1 TRINITY_DN3878_c1_g1~~TRINITY_DN3878_c1_g1_i5.p1  ORF type:complete len:574 (+),score=63.38 TRINITY_DN3878_c1_g1_i5:110-1723(+)
MPEITIPQVIEIVGWGPYHNSLLAIASFFWFSEAMAMMFTPFLSSSLAFTCYSEITKWQAVALSMVVFYGMLIGSIFFSWLCERIGRKITIMVSALLAVVANILVVFSINFVMLLVSRFLVGVGISSTPIVISLFMELSPVKTHSKSMVVLAASYAFGILFTSSAAWIVFKFADPVTAWRYLAGVTVVPSLGVLCISPLLPESPTWLLAKGKVLASSDVLYALSLANDKSLNFEKLSLEQQADAMEPTLMGLGLTRKMCTVTVLLWLIWGFVTFQYFGVLFFMTREVSVEQSYCPSSYNFNNTLWQNNTSSGHDPLQCFAISDHMFTNLVISCFGDLAGLVLSMYIVDWIERRAIMVVSLAVASVCIWSLYLCYPIEVGMFATTSTRAFLTIAFQTLWLYTMEFYPATMQVYGISLGFSISRLSGAASYLVVIFLAGESVGGDVASITLLGATSVATAIAICMLPYDTYQHIEWTSRRNSIGYVKDFIKHYNTSSDSRSSKSEEWMSSYTETTSGGATWMGQSSGEYTDESEEYYNQ